tara:strand:+ start:212 stop:937 length:726 start_codon:yes stop_codon:yes gene_type:complete
MIKRIELNIVDVCNRSCTFCPRGNGYPNTSNHLTYENSFYLKKRLKQYRDVITISGFGEPLLHKDFERVVSNVLPKNASEIILITNGDYLDDKKYEKIKNTGITHIRVSLYDEDNSDYFKSFIKDTKLSFNHYYNGPAHEVNRNEIYDKSGKQTKGKCYLPFYKLFVDYDLKTYLCSNDWSKSVNTGDLKNEPLEDIWYSNKYNKYRDLLEQGKRKLFPCSNCDICGTLEGESFFNDFRRL